MMRIIRNFKVFLMFWRELKIPVRVDYQIIEKSVYRKPFREDISMIDGRIHEKEEIPVNPKDNN